MRPDELIDRLVADADPVRRLWTPPVRSAIWCGATVAFIGLFAFGYGLRVDLPEKLSEPLGTLGTGCIFDWIDYGADGFQVGNSAICFVLIVGTGLVPSSLLYAMLRSARPFRPVLSTATGTLAVASIAAAGLRLFHQLDASLMVLVWQFGSVAAIVVAMSLFGSRLFPEDDRNRQRLLGRCI